MKYRNFIRIIKKYGFVYHRGSGGHDIYKNGKKTLSIPAQVEVNRMLARRLLKEIGHHDWRSV